MNRQELSAASSIGLLYLVRMLGLFMVLPVLPVFAPEINQATPLLIGMAVGIYGLSQGLLQIPLGFLSDKIGRKPVITGGLVLFILGSFIAAMAEDVYGLILGRFLQGCGAIASTLMALMSDVTRVDQRSKSMAIIGIAIASSFGLSLVLGPLIAGHFGVAGIFYLTGILGVVSLLVLWMVVPSVDIRSNNLDSTVQKERLSSVLANTQLWRLNFSIFTLHFLLVSAFAGFPVLFEGTGEIPVDDHWFYYLILLVSSALLMSPFMWLSDKTSDVRPVLVTMIGFALVAFTLLSMVSGYWLVLLGVVLFFLAFNLLEVVLPAQVSRISAAGSRGTSMGVYTSCQFLGIFVGGIVSGWILQKADISVLMAVNAGLVAIWLLIAFGLKNLGNIGSRTVQLDPESDNSLKNELSSLNGVIDVVIIESDQVAYLKVDESQINDAELNALIANRT